MKKVKVGVVGVGRGRTMIQFCKLAENAQLVAICDSWEDGLNAAKHDYGEDGIGYYTDYDAFLNHDMDVVMLANYANEHAPFAIKAMEKGKNVISEVLPCQCMKEAVDLIECVERTGKKYFYAENYCFMPAPREMRRLYREGAIGPLEYCEGEYVHNCESGWAGLTRGNQPDHWRNVMFTSFYCTHSMGPLVHISGLRPVSVSGFEIPYGSRMKRMGAVAGTAAIESHALTATSSALSVAALAAGSALFRTFPPMRTGRRYPWQ